MENPIYIGLARQTALQQQMDVVAQNIANVDTPGYRASQVLFDTLIEKPQGMKAEMGFPEVQKTYRTMGEGVFRQTGNDFDVALSGPGFFTVQGPDGKTYYTRAGNFKMNADHQLVTAQGFPVLSNGGSTIQIPDDTTQIRIDDAGNIAGDAGQIAQLGVKEFDSPRDMKPVGNTLYEGAGAPKDSATTRVMQGTVEGSNVQSVYEMTQMISVLRDYQSVQRMMQSEDQRLRNMISTITKTQA